MIKLCKALTATLIFVFLFSGISFGQTTIMDSEAKATKLKEMGLFLGNAKGFELDRAPTRLEAAVILVKLLGKEKEARQLNSKTYFTDVPAWGSPYVKYLCTKGYSKGISAKEYGSDRKITALEFVTFILRALGYHDNWGAFDWKYSLDAAWNVGLIDKEYYDNLKSKEFTRGDAVSICYNALSLCIYGKTERLINKLITDGAVVKDIADKNGINTSDSFYTLQNYGEIDGVPYYDCITAELDPWHGKTFKASSKAIRYKIDDSKLPEKAKGFKKLGLYQIYKTDLTQEEISKYINNISSDGWIRDVNLESDGYFRFFCGANNGWLITLLDSQNNVLAYTLVHFLGVGDNMPTEMTDATDRYEKIDLGELGGVPYFNGLRIYGLYNNVIPMVDRNTLPEGMKGFKKIGLLSMSDTRKEDLDKEYLTKVILQGGGGDYSDDMLKNTQCSSGPVMFVTISDDTGKTLGYCIVKKIITTPL